LIDTRDRTLTPSQARLFDSLVESHQAAFHRLARRLAPSLEDAEDLLQETLIDAYRGFHTFRPDTKFYTWVARIMTNNQLDRVRRKRHPMVSLEHLAEEGGQETLELPDDTSNPERLLLHAELDHPYHSALEALQPAHRATVMLCDLEGVTYEEAAREEQCPVGTIRSRLHRAHKAIRGFLARLSVEEAPEPQVRAHSRRAFLQLGTAAAAGAALAQFGAEEAHAAGPLRVLVWSEGTAPRDVYPHDINEAIADAFRGEACVQVRTARFGDPDFGLSDAALKETDVLIWWGDDRQSEVSLERSRAVARRVREGMGFIALHSAHRSAPLRELLQAPCAPASGRTAGEAVEISAAAPRHPIAEGLERFRIPRTQGYEGSFDVPKPDVVVFDGSYGAGDRVWHGMTWARGKGRIFYFQPGHEAYPIYFQDEVRRVLRNAARWCAATSPR
jgi:RNA polymerase sigma factor (sigma-70 family)